MLWNVYNNSTQPLRGSCMILAISSKLTSVSALYYLFDTLVPLHSFDNDNVMPK